MDRITASVIVTGGAGSFGSATVRWLALMGTKVVIAAVSDERGEALAREVGTGSLYVPTDLTPSPRRPPASGRCAPPCKPSHDMGHT